MNFFWFDRSPKTNIKELMVNLEDLGFSGVLFTYSFYNNDYFVKIANTIDTNKKIKYMIAIRPYTISPQYLCMINNAFNKISKDRIIINLLTGWIYDSEKLIGGIQGPVNDNSSNIDRSNYLIEYVKTLTETKSKMPDFYVSVTNKILFDNVCDNKVIIPYDVYIKNELDLDYNKTMISITPVIRETEEELLNLKEIKLEQSDVFYFTVNEFKEFINNLELKNIYNILMGHNDGDQESKKQIMSFVGSFTDKGKK